MAKKKRKPSAYNRHVGREMKAGKTMKQAAKSWKGGSSTKKTRRKRTVAKNKNYKSRAKGLIGKYGMAGLAEDAAIGYIGSNLLMSQGYPLESALPMTRVVQGLAGKVLNRRGKGRLEHGIIDLIDVYLIRQGLPLQGLSLKAWM